MLAKQTKRLTERCADLETRSTELEKEYDDRLMRETAIPPRRARPRPARRTSSGATFLQQQIDQNATPADWTERDAALRAEIDAAGEQLAAAKVELVRINAELAEANRAAPQQAQVLTDQIARYETVAAAWQELLNESLSQKASEETAQSHAQTIATITAELEQTRAKLQEAETQRKALQQQNAATGTLSARTSRGPRKTSPNVRTAARRPRRTTFPGPGYSPPADGRIPARQKFARRGASLPAQATRIWRPKGTHGSHNRPHKWFRHLRNRSPNSNKRTNALRLIANASSARRGTLRAIESRPVKPNATLRKIVRKSRSNGSSCARGRKISNKSKGFWRSRSWSWHANLPTTTPLKTVAAVGIFVIMVLGSVFISVYKFVNPIYRSEAVVQLTPPAATVASGTAATQAWLTRQMEFIRSEDVTFTAWKILRPRRALRNA